MKYFIIIILGCLSFNCISQDIIYLNDSTTIKCSVENISIEVVTYTKNNQPKPLYTIPTDEVQYIQFDNGSVDYLHEFRVTKQSTDPLPIDSTESYILGMREGFDNFNSRPVKLGTTLTTFVFPPAGLATTVIASGTPPKTGYYYNPKYSNNQFYQEGYNNGALLKKRKDAWRGFGLGMGILVGFSLLLSATAF